MNIRTRIWFAIHTNRRNKIVARFAQLCKNVYRAFEHGGYNVFVNGERSLLATTCRGLGAPVLFDVGANVGEWSRMAHTLFPSAQIHAFELNPALIQTLSTNLAHAPQVKIHPYGLSSCSGTTDFYCYEGEASVLSGLRTAVHSHVTHKKRQSTIRTGDEVCRLLRINRIDFIKIDAEGHDYEVIQGFSGMLASGRVTIIQFEHEGGRYLKDFYDAFASWGYALGKLYANHVAFREHNFEMEHCLGPNYVAVHRTNNNLIKRLEAGWKWSAQEC
jgi:FkbM family methyltransferase